MKTPFKYILSITAVAVLVQICPPVRSALAQPQLRVDRIAVCTDIIDRQPFGEGDAFADSIGTLFCYTEVRGTGDSTFVTHVWYYEKERMAEVRLNIKGYRWRTWSSKKIQLDWTGNWRVDVVSADGRILKSKRFRVIGTTRPLVPPDTSRIR